LSRQLSVGEQRAERDDYERQYRQVPVKRVSGVLLCEIVRGEEIHQSGADDAGGNRHEMNEDSA